MMSFSRLPRRVPAACSPSLNVVSNTATFSDATFSDMLSLTWHYSECLFGDAVDLTPILLEKPTQFKRGLPPQPLYGIIGRAAACAPTPATSMLRSEEHTSELQSRQY